MCLKSLNNCCEKSVLHCCLYWILHTIHYSKYLFGDKVFVQVESLEEGWKHRLKTKSLKEQESVAAGLVYGLAFFKKVINNTVKHIPIQTHQLLLFLENEKVETWKCWDHCQTPSSFYGHIQYKEILCAWNKKAFFPNSASPPFSFLPLSVSFNTCCYHVSFSILSGKKMHLQTQYTVQTVYFQVLLPSIRVRNSRNMEFTLNYNILNVPLHIFIKPNLGHTHQQCSYCEDDMD